MIKSMNQARAVQERRVSSSKRGYAKAVRRFLLRTTARDATITYTAKHCCLFFGNCIFYSQ